MSCRNWVILGLILGLLMAGEAWSWGPRKGGGYHRSWHGWEHAQGAQEGPSSMQGRGMGQGMGQEMQQGKGGMSQGMGRGMNAGMGSGMDHQGMKGCPMMLPSSPKGVSPQMLRKRAQMMRERARMMEEMAQEMEKMADKMAKGKVSQEEWDQFRQKMYHQGF